MTRHEFAVKVKDEAVAEAVNEVKRVRSTSPSRILEEKLCVYWDMFANNQSYGECGIIEEEFTALCRVFHRMSFDMTSLREASILVWNQWIDERVASGESAYYKLKISKS
jgi:hypothetical protein